MNFPFDIVKTVFGGVSIGVAQDEALDFARFCADSRLVLMAKTDWGTTFDGAQYGV